MQSRNRLDIIFKYRFGENRCMRGMNHNMSASREKKKRLAQGDLAVTAAPETKKGLSKTAKKAL